MPKTFVYVGKDESSPDEITVRGLTFVRDGEAVVVEDAALAEGLSGNPEFVEEGNADGDYGRPESTDEANATAELQDRLDDALDEVDDLREQLKAASDTIEALRAAQVSDEPATPAEEPVDAGPEALAEIDASEDWAAEHHSTRIRWANALSEGQVTTKDEADDIILSVLADREQD
ncbi:MAG: hypothetical protein AAGK02_07130 [Pseudomonadota bacterium]